MTSLKTKNICFLAAFLFLAIVPTLAEVVKSVSECNQFVRQGTPANIPGVLKDGKIQDQNRYKVICQTYANKPWYLTVYDTAKKIPVFSAYKYSGKKAGGRPTKDWKIEPQLEDSAASKDMMMEERGKTYTKQAVNADYDSIKTDYNRGHLFPVSHTGYKNEQISTFTLTNAVPQIISFNDKSWAYMEKCIQYIMFYYINQRKMECFVVVGAKPGNNNRPINSINIPSVMWSAFYCSDTERSIAGAHWGDNVKIQSKTLLVMETLEELKEKQGNEAFPGTNPEAFDIDDIKDPKVKQNVRNNCRFQ
ncbi:endonuclease domain-containing 1 protein-like [Larimichthys crocea]|uniref:endonuclease domain-containing 1 protein-like n=1 Tax=Larimichthys crocea TaxID=215358 RepID=UPI000F5F9017|nr:endonuclease domain-containing 1 protein-like [Larimichthys crocea]XP_027143427.1 endonuclease domain-containing 1 protein-like [Larimichthys crocea]